MTNEEKEIRGLLEELELSMYRLKGVFKRYPQQIHAAITTDRYPTLRDKILYYLRKRVEGKRRKGGIKQIIPK